MKLCELINGVGDVTVHGDEQIEIAGVAFDSREARLSYLFAALKGEKRDGNSYIGEAVRAGVAAVLSEQPPQDEQGISWVHTKDARTTLAKVAKRWFGAPDEELVLVGVTGTNGKTSVAHILHTILGRCIGPAGRIGTISYNTGRSEVPAPLTTPEATSIQEMLREMRDADCHSAVMEVSSHAIDRKRVIELDFNVVIFTNLSRDHLDYHGDMESYYEVKRRLFSAGSGSQPTAVINIDDEWGRRLVAEVDLEMITFGLEGAADVRLLDVKTGLDGIRMELKTPAGNYSLRSSLIGSPNVQNILAAFAAAHALGLKGEEVTDAIADVETVRGRLERVETGRPFDLIIDYAHSDEALRRLLLTAGELIEGRGGRIIVVFGCGGDRDRGKRPLMGQHAVRLADVAVLTSDNPRSENPLDIIREVEKGIEQVADRRAEYHMIPDRRQAIGAAIRMAGPGDLVLLAGKGHEDYQIIGEQRLPFDDRQVALEAIEEL